MQIPARWQGDGRLEFPAREAADRFTPEAMEKNVAP